MLRSRTTEQSIDEGSQVQQILRSGYEIMAGPWLSGSIAGHGIRPLDRNMATAAVRTENEEKQVPVLPAYLLQNFKRSASERMRFTRDPYRGRKVTEVGSVSGSPSAKFRMPSYSNHLPGA